jgi:hypothetical protein
MMPITASTLPPKVSPVDYLGRHVLPVLVSGLEETLRVAKKTEVQQLIIHWLQDISCNSSVDSPPPSPHGNLVHNY